MIIERKGASCRNFAIDVILFLIVLVLFVLAGRMTAAPLALYSPAVVDLVSGDTVQPALIHSMFIDTVTVKDTVGWNRINDLLTGRRWPDSVRVRMFGINPAMLWTGLAAFSSDSVEVLDEAKQSYYCKVWWSGSKTMLEDSVIVPGSYKVSKDALIDLQDNLIKK